jgi:hypothetical protein
MERESHFDKKQILTEELLKLIAQQREDGIDRAEMIQEVWDKICELSGIPEDFLTRWKGKNPQENR